MKNIYTILLLFIYINSFSQEGKIIDSLKQSAQNQTDTTLIITLIKITEKYTSFQNDSAKKYSQQALYISKKINNQFYIAKSLYYLGYTHYFKEDFFNAKQFLDSALNIFANIKDTLEVIKTTEKIGMIYFKQSNYPKAHEFFTQELKLAEKVNYTEAQATSINNIAIIYSNEKDYTNALEYYKSALSIYKKTKTINGIAILQNNIGDIYKKLGKYDAAFEYYFKSLKNFEKTKYGAGIAYCKSNIGETFLLNNNTKDALTFNYQAEKLFLKTKDNFGLAEVYNNLGETYTKKRNFKKGEFYFLKSIKHAEKIGSLDHLQDNFLKLSEIYNKNGNYGQAYNYYRKYSTLKDSIYNIENAKTISSLKINYETEKKDSKIKLLNSKSELDKIKISRQKNILYILSIGLFVFIIFTSIIFIQKHNKNQAYKILVHKNLALMESEQKLSDAKFENEAIIDNISSNNKNKQNADSENTLLTDEQREEHIKGILELMEKDKVFLEKDVSVNKIAEKLNTNKLYVSNIINSVFNQNFNTFINTYRIKEARLLLADPKFNNYSIEGIAYEVGFNTKSSFNSAFKKFTGVTPSFFKKQVSGNKKNKEA